MLLLLLLLLLRLRPTMNHNRPPRDWSSPQLTPIQLTQSHQQTPQTPTSSMLPVSIFPVYPSIYQ